MKSVKTKRQAILLGFLAILLTAPLFAQQVIAGDNPGGQPSELTFMTFFGPDGEGNTYGSPYLFNDWKDGYVVMADGDTVTDINLALDLYEQELIIGNSWMKPTRLDMETVAGFVFEENSPPLEFVRCVLAEDATTAYLQVLHRVGKYELLCRKSKYLKKGNDYDSSRLYNEYRDRREEYYLVLPGAGLAHKVPAGRKAFLRLLEERAAAVEAFIKEYKLRPGDPKDLRRIIDYLAEQSES